MSNNERIEKAEKKLKQKIEKKRKEIEEDTTMSESEKIDFLFSEAKKIDEKQPIILDK
jgi:hypothetical protein